MKGSEGKGQVKGEENERALHQSNGYVTIALKATDNIYALTEILQI